MRHSLLPLLACLACPVLAPAQVMRPRPAATLSEEFADIRGVREVAGGRVLVRDYIDQRVVLADFASGRVIDRVTEGSGPQEARLPTRLVPVAGDSTLLVDLGNARLQLLDGTGKVVRTIANLPDGALGVRAVDRRGRFYLTIPGWMERDKALPNDSVRVVRLDPASGQRATVAVVQGERMRSDIREPAMTPRIPTVGYASFDGWTVAPDGGLRIVRGGDYRVEVTPAGGGATTITSANRYPTATVTGADRERYVRRFMAMSPMSGKGTNGGMGFSPTPSAAELAQLVRGTEFAERHPMFDPDRVLIDRSGTLWVGRPAAEGQPVRYDRFSASGAGMSAVEFPAGRRIIAFGSTAIYVIAETELGLQHLERYDLPR